MCFVATSVFHEVPFIRNPRGSLLPACFTRFRLAEKATHQHARARRQRSGQAVTRKSKLAKRNPGLARASSNENALIGDASVTVILEFRCNQHISRGSVWPRNLKAFSAKLETRYSLRVSILQAAKRNGGGVFVAFVMVGSGGRGRLHRHCQVTRSNARATSIPFGRKSHASTRKGTQATGRASSDSQEQAGQTEPGTRKG